jgi:tripartite-type tricarboxylate transporter receptor subunit TctC
MIDLPDFRLAAATALALGCAGAAAQTAPLSYPTHPVRLVVPFPPGAASDFLARTIGQKLGEQYAQQFIIDNRPGAGGVIGSSIVARALPEGYTLGVMGQPHLINALLQKEPPYHPLKDFASVIQLAALPNVLVVPQGLPVKSVADLIALAKARPGTLNFGSAGIGASSHIAAALFNTAAGIDTVHVPFKLLSDVFTEMYAGRVQYYLFPLPAIMPQLREGRLRALAVGSPARIAALPDVPAIAESGLPGFDSQSWFGVIGPAGMPRKVIAQLHDDIARLLQSADVKERFARQGAEPAFGSSGDFSRLQEAEFQRFRKLIQDTGMKTQ